MKKILAFSGSNGSQSINQKLVSLAAGLLKDLEVNIISLRDFTAPLYSMDIEKKEGFPEHMIALNELFNRYDAFLISLPEHNGSVTPVFKNTVDWISRIEMPVFKNKPVCLLSASPGIRGGAHNLQHISGLMPFWGGRVMSVFSLGSFSEKWDKEKNDISSPREKELLRKTLQSFEESLCR
ncbi:MAG: NAD(P)H-dependent oxidoreductase [FCB group bacterium]|nr:NAD(P)H-dependent oxidoreductase [FCB group bacterium]